MGGSMAMGSSAPPPPDPNPSVDIKKKKKKKKKTRKRLLSEIGSSQNQDRNLSQAEIGNQDESGAKEKRDEGGEAGSSRDQDQHHSQAKNVKHDESRAGKDGDEKGEEIQEEEKGKGEVANVVAPEASSSATTEKTNPAPRSPSPPPICPICYENMDAMDLSFHPCKCRFELCLFCYNHIIEQGDGRCPGCRISYDTSEC